MSKFPWSWMLLQIVLNHKNFIKRLLECFCHGKFQFIDIKCQLRNLTDTRSSQHFIIHFWWKYLLWMIQMIKFVYCDNKCFINMIILMLSSCNCESKGKGDLFALRIFVLPLFFGEYSHLPKFWIFSCFCCVMTLRCECPVYNWSDPTPWRNNQHQEHLRGLWLWQPSSLLNKCWASTLQLWNTVLHALNHHTNSR